MPCPSVSVVMAVYNGEKTLPSALKSVLSQEGVDLECIVVDDGSTDNSGRILDDAARNDSRLKVVHKKNEGLTRALIDGCALAAAPWIARQDADDISLPGRLRKQLDRARQPDAPVLVACGSMYKTPDGHEMFANAPDRDLNQKILDIGESPCPHGAAFFSKAVYEAAGGYRPEFYYAQDLDLFSRLAERGPVDALSEVLYCYTFSPFSISTHAFGSQKQFHRILRACRDARMRGMSEASLLAEAETLSLSIRTGSVRRESPFAGYYFMGSCLQRKNPKAAAVCFLKALSVRPWSVRALIKLLSVRGGF